MKHLRRFNESDYDDDDFIDEEEEEYVSYDNEEYFRPRINWKLFRHLQEQITSIVDKGIEMTIYIKFDYRSQYGTDIYHDYYDGFTNVEKWVEEGEVLDDDIIEELTKLCYGIKFHNKSQLTTEDNDRISKMKQDTASKFGVSINTDEYCEFSDKIKYIHETS